MWKVVDYMEGKEGNARFPSRDLPVYGPLPVKRWVPQPGEKRHRLSDRTPKPSTGNSPSSAKDYTAQRAVLYARWLAERDGLMIPEDCGCVAVWDVTASGAKRVRAVHWQQRNGHFPSSREAIRTLLIIAIPHWDWVPQVTEETLPDTVVSFATALTPAQACRLINIADPLTPEEELMFSTMSNDDLVSELQA